MNATMEINEVNGIDHTSQHQIIDTLKEHIEMAKVTFRTDNCWEGGARSRSQFTAYGTGQTEHEHEEMLVATSDMPGSFLGTDSAPTPTEYALHALAACMNTTMVYNCAAHGITVRSSRVRIEGILDARGFLQISDKVSPGFQQITAEFEVDADATADVIERLVKCSPMFDTITRPTPVQVSLHMA